MTFSFIGIKIGVDEPSCAVTVSWPSVDGFEVVVTLVLLVCSSVVIGSVDTVSGAVTALLITSSVVVDIVRGVVTELLVTSSVVVGFVEVANTSSDEVSVVLLVTSSVVVEGGLVGVVVGGLGMSGSGTGGWVP